MDFLDFADDFRNEDGAQRGSRTDQLPDFHLRSPLKPMTYLYDDTVRSLRNQEAIELLTEIRRDLKEGDPITLRSMFTDYAEVESTAGAEDSISDLLVRIERDSRLNFPLPVEMMIDAVRQFSDNFPIILWSRMRLLSKILSTMNAISSRRSPPGYYIKIKKNLYATMIRNTRLLMTSTILGVEIIDESTGHGFVLCYDSDWIRMISDVYTERFLLSVGSGFGHHMNPDHYPSQSIIEKLWLWGDSVLAEFGNDGFKLLKAYEALCIGTIQSRHSSQIIGCRTFLENTINDLLLEDSRYEHHVILLLELFESVESPHHMTQLYGMHRIWGHPIVDSTKGMSKVMLIGRKEISRSGVVAVDVGRSFKIMFCREYRKKNGVYPKFVDNGSQLCEAMKKNDGSILDSRLMSNAEWDELSFDKCFEIPETFNLSMVVADKSISLTRSELRENVRRRKTVMNQEKRRGVLRWINDQSIHPREFLKQVNDGDFPDDHKIIGLTPKERELNPTPRMFALMSHLMRIYVVVTEQMLSDEVLGMFPQITMTDSLLDLTKKLYSTVKPQSDGASVRRRNKTWTSKTVCISLDFEKWNGHMRYESTYHVFKALGELFGLPNLYNRTYEIFQESLIYLADGSYLPRYSGNEMIMEEPLSFTGHKGGMEGLRQKGWTIFTVCGLNMVCSKYNCTYKIMGMGDNQVLQITLYTYKVAASGEATEAGSYEMKLTLESLFADLIYTFRQLGLPLKPLETWMSEDLYLYGKYPLLRGVPLSMDLKKIMRMFHNSNDDVMTIENGMGTVYGNAASATQLSCCSIVPYMVGMFMASYCASCFLEYHPLLGHGILKEVEAKSTWDLFMPGKPRQFIPIGRRTFNIQCLRLLMQLVPRTLGGYNSLNIFEIIMRGFPDNLSRDLTYIYQIVRLDKRDALDEALTNWIHPIYMPDKNFKLLIEDVSSVNLLSPRSPSSGIRQAVEKFIGSGRTVKNLEFKDLMNSKIKHQADMLAEKLCSGSDIHIRLMHDIYASTIIGYVDGILSKVTKASTIQRLAVATNEKDIMQVVVNDEINFFRFFLWRSSTRPNNEISECPTEMAKRLRSESWGKSLRGVTTPFPMAYLSPTRCGETGNCLCMDGYISIHLPDSQETNVRWNRTLGSNAPYLGSITKEKVVTGVGSKVYSSEPLIRRPLNLLRAINWFIPPKSITASVIRELTHAVTDINPTSYEGQSEGTAGAEVHRYRDMSLKHGALSSSNYLYPTRMHISTDNFVRYSKGGDNYDVHFQACLCSLTEWCNMRLMSWLKYEEWIPKVIHFKQTCYCCVTKLDESFVDLPDPLTNRYIPSRKTNPYLFVSGKLLTEVHKMRPLLSRSLSVMPVEEYVRMDCKDKMRWLVDVVSDKIYLDIISQRGEDNSFSLCLTDVKAYERTMFLKLSPREVYLCLIDKLLRHSDMTMTKTVSGRRAVGKIQVDRALALIHSCPVSSFLGLGMFYSWSETIQKMHFSSFCVMPNTFPITTESMCMAARTTLSGLIEVQWGRRDRFSNVLVYDFAKALHIHKLFSWTVISRYSKCNDCIVAIADTDSGAFGTDELTIMCCSGHDAMELIRSKCKISYVTLERLRKDAENAVSIGCEDIASKINFSYPEMSRMSRTEITTLIDFRRMRHDLVAWRCDMTLPSRSLVFCNQNRLVTTSSLHKVLSYPTSTAYRYVEILSAYGTVIRGRVMVVGDGLGVTSELVSIYCHASRVTISTLADTGLAAPQTYPHSVQPIVRSSPYKIDGSTMIDKHNDILSESYTEEWRPVMASLNSLLSDIEIIGPERSDDRTSAIRKLLEICDWEGFIIKDYIYSLREFTDRCSIILPKMNGDIKLVTSKMRSVRAPEVWWIGQNSKAEYTVRRCYDPRSIRELWDDCVRSLLHDTEYQDPTVLEDLTRRVLSRANLASVHSVVLEWSSLAVVGKMLPSDGSYTEAFYKLYKGKRPKIVSDDRDNADRILHLSDYYKMREILFGLAVSMIADIKMRQRLINESELWVLDWEPNQKYTVWVPYLYKSDGRFDLPQINVADYVPYLSMFMAKKRLLFREVKKSIRFRSVGGVRSHLVFPVSGSAYATFTGFNSARRKHND
ncbi:RNA-dependent RNA polymerase [Wuhan Insect virus 5]|uniref:Replicase n=1 Tax=Wuhan Insect virus 5 TaxID=1608110 RepID=A0A0B5KK98_9RHAB|nr:RNA-dependent RNA polymerase [Wuhan Insect virus 5]AJG39185.1 RNA-dependent RNA polymerase [Wuhan Insect virus 5]